MKKFIDRMDNARRDVDDGAGTSGKEEASSNEKSDKKKKGWGLGGVVRKVTGGTSSGSSGSVPAGSGASASQVNKPEEVQGVQVDFYMVIVSLLCTPRNRSESMTSDRIALPVPQVYRQYRADHRGRQYDLVLGPPKS